MRTTNTLILFSFLVSRVVGERNVTIDDFDLDRITYKPAQKWIATDDPAITSDRYKMTTTYTAWESASASFNFTGATAFYFMGYGGASADGSAGTIRIIFDNQEYTVPANTTSQPQQILFSKKRLDISKMYVFKVMKLSPDGGRALGVDAFIFTVPDDSPQGRDGAGSGIPVGAIVGGVLGGVCLVVLIVIPLWWLRKRNQARDDLLAANPLLPLHTGSKAVPLREKQALAARDSTAPDSSSPRPSVTSLSTRPVTSSFPLSQPSSSDPAHASPSTAGPTDASPPPYVD